MEKLNKQMDDALNTKVAALNATDDETGDGKVDALDLKHQLDRVEAQLELQDQQNRALLRSQKRLLWAAIAIVVVLCLIMGGLLLRFNTAYNQVIITCAQVNEIAGTLQDSLAKLDTEQLDSMMQTLPDIADKLSQIDVDALNDVMAKLPATMVAEVVAAPEGEILSSSRRLLTVEDGARGLMQSQGLFQHVKNLPQNAQESMKAVSYTHLTLPTTERV